MKVFILVSYIMEDVTDRRVLEVHQQLHYAVLVQ